ncbi:MAG: hypothetical protein KIT72_12045 [Polyangiaceae bacterium]|nr:hypothetical protein [Polyangiaceae bacterium]MCW5791146.1 hypothetical protein [Polyangiaceae bacterium]
MTASLGFVACGGSDDDPGGNNGGSSGSGGSGGSGGTAGTGGTGGGNSETNPTCGGETSCTLPPERDTTGTAPSGGAKTFAMSKLFLGDTKRDGTASVTAWQDYGYNLDGIVSNRNGSNHCAPQPGSNPAQIKTDGPGGIDNSFGANLLPIILSLAADAGDRVNESIAEGDFTVMIHNDSLGTEANQTPISGALYGGSKLGAVPRFDGTDVWPATYELLNDGDITKPKVTFPTAYVTNGIWVSGSAATVSLSLSISGFTLDLAITNAIITADISDPNNVKNGLIAGVLNTEALIDALRNIAGSLDPSLCSGTTFEGIAQQIRGASDLMADGTNGDSSKACNGISIALGFEAKPVILGDAAAPAEPGEDQCE